MKWKIKKKCVIPEKKTEGNTEFFITKLKWMKSQTMNGISAHQNQSEYKRNSFHWYDAITNRTRKRVRYKWVWMRKARDSRNMWTNWFKCKAKQIMDELCQGEKLECALCKQMTKKQQTFESSMNMIDNWWKLFDSKALHSILMWIPKATN